MLNKLKKLLPQAFFFWKNVQRENGESQFLIIRMELPSFAQNK